MRSAGILHTQGWHGAAHTHALGCALQQAVAASHLRSCGGSDRTCCQLHLALGTIQGHFGNSFHGCENEKNGAPAPGPATARTRQRLERLLAAVAPPAHKVGGHRRLLLPSYVRQQLAAVLSIIRPTCMCAGRWRRQQRPSTWGNATASKAAEVLAPAAATAGGRRQAAGETATAIALS